MNNTLIVEEHGRGKTPFLLKNIEYNRKPGTKIIILDSATAHINKSLIVKLRTIFPYISQYNFKNEKDIIHPRDISCLIDSPENFFPYNEIIVDKNEIICFDLSYFLEKGYELYDETGDKIKFWHYRNLFINLSYQIITVLLILDNRRILNNCIIVMDEIELPEPDSNIISLQRTSRIIAAIHPVCKIRNLYSNFRILKYIPIKVI